MKHKSILWLVLASFISNIALPYGASAQTLNLPAPTQLLNISQNYSFPVLKGLRLDSKNPLNITFIIDAADQDKVSKEDAALLIRYFLAGLTIPQSDLWVNLSPYEQNRIVPQGLSDTDLGEDMLAQDYFLKQLSASLTYPESDLGKKYWQSINGVGAQRAVPFSNFNKIWIMPDNAQVYEHKDTALIAQASLKVMMEQDYLASQKNGVGVIHESPATNNAFKTQILPIINKEVNTGKNFAQLRQVYYSLVLATWFKKKFEQSFYKSYINQKKIAGIDINDKSAKDKIYALYCEAFQKGVYNYVKSERVGANDYSPAIKITKRQYFSGGVTCTNMSATVGATPVTAKVEEAVMPTRGVLVETASESAAADSAQNVVPDVVMVGEAAQSTHLLGSQLNQFRLMIRNASIPGGAELDIDALLATLPKGATAMRNAVEQLFEAMDEVKPEKTDIDAIAKANQLNSDEQVALAVLLHPGQGLFKWAGDKIAMARLKGYLRTFAENNTNIVGYYKNWDKAVSGSIKLIGKHPELGKQIINALIAALTTLDINRNENISIMAEQALVGIVEYHTQLGKQVVAALEKVIIMTLNGEIEARFRHYAEYAIIKIAERQPELLRPNMTTTLEIARLEQERRGLKQVSISIVVGSHSEGIQHNYDDANPFGWYEEKEVDDYGTNPDYEPAQARIREIDKQLVVLVEKFRLEAGSGIHLDTTQLSPFRTMLSKLARPGNKAELDLDALLATLPENATAMRNSVEELLDAMDSVTPEKVDIGKIVTTNKLNQDEETALAVLLHPGQGVFSWGKTPQARLDKYIQALETIFLEDTRNESTKIVSRIRALIKEHSEQLLNADTITALGTVLKKSWLSDSAYSGAAEEIADIVEQRLALGPQAIAALQNVLNEGSHPKKEAYHKAAYQIRVIADKHPELAPQAITALESCVLSYTRETHSNPDSYAAIELMAIAEKRLDLGQQTIPALVNVLKKPWLHAYLYPRAADMIVAIVEQHPELAPQAIMHLKSAVKPADDSFLEKYLKDAGSSAADALGEIVKKHPTLLSQTERGSIANMLKQRGVKVPAVLESNPSVVQPTNKVTVAEGQKATVRTQASARQPAVAKTSKPEHLSAHQLTAFRKVIKDAAISTNNTDLFWETLDQSLPANALPMKNVVCELWLMVTDKGALNPEKVDINKIVADNQLNADEQVALVLLLHPGQGAGKKGSTMAPTASEEATRPTGGIDVRDIKVGVSPSSLPVELPGIGSEFFQHYSLKIVKMEAIGQ